MIPQDVITPFRTVSGNWGVRYSSEKINLYFSQVGDYIGFDDWMYPVEFDLIAQVCVGEDAPIDPLTLIIQDQLLELVRGGWRVLSHSDVPEWLNYITLEEARVATEHLPVYAGRFVSEYDPIKVYESRLESIRWEYDVLDSRYQRSFDRAGVRYMDSDPGLSITDRIAELNKEYEFCKTSIKEYNAPYSIL